MIYGGFIKDCNKSYGENCFSCDIAEYIIASVGAGMDMKMLNDFGELKPAIFCPYKKGYLILNLTNKQLNNITDGKLEELTRENYNLLKKENLKKFIKNNFNKIETEVLQPYNILPEYP